MKFNRFSLFAVLALLALVVAPVSANHSWGGYHWGRTSNPFTIKLGNNVTGDWGGHLSQTSSDWNKSAVLHTTIVAGQASGKCRPTAGRDEVCNGRYGNNGWLGLAQIWLNGSHITQGTTKLNDSYSMNQAEKEHVMCQEVGHTFGLDHQDTSGASLNTCMDYYQNTSDSDTKSTTPNAHDYSELSTIYSHLDSVNTWSRPVNAPPAWTETDLATPDQWGREIFRSSDGSQSVFVADFGNGYKVLTYVTWAQGHGRNWDTFIEKQK